MELAELETYLHSRLAGPLPGADAQWRFAPSPALKNWRPDDRPAGARHAAALILIYPGFEGPSFLLTERRDDLPHHPGQISLPGGALEPGEDPAAGALREAHEEVGIHPSHVRVIGSLSTLWVVVSGFVLHPIVGVAGERPEFRAEPREVEALIEAPVRSVGDHAVIGREERIRNSVAVSYPYFDIEGHHVWGATGMILAELRALIVTC